MLRSLRAKLVLTYAGLTLLAVGALAIYTINSLEQLLLQRLADDLVSQSRLVAEQVADDLAVGRLDGLRATLERVDAATTARALVVDRQSRVAGATEPAEREGLGELRQEPGLREALDGQTSRLLQPRSGGRDVLYVVSPVRQGGQLVGAVRLTYELDDVEGTLRALNITVALGALGVVTLAALISFGFARAIGDPIREVSRAARALAAGDLRQQLGPGSNDEVGELVSSFNAMAEQLRDADVARREFASDVSHELHSLAGSMQTAAEALDRGAAAEPPIRDRLIAGLVGHTRRLNRLSEDLLQLARLEEGRLTLVAERCSLRDVARGALDEFAAEARQRGLALSLHAEVDAPLLGDAVRLQQALGNLVENALKYTAAGGSVTIALAADDGEYRLSVSDTGQGIPPDELSNIWQRYYRVEGRSSGGPGGTGLGLAIAAGIVAAHGGRIEAESVPGRGSVFTIHLPRPAGESQL